jgi:glycosyltransferase involved in cell wall biosynthesis
MKMGLAFGKRVIFLTEPFDSPSTRFRVLQYAPYLNKRNIDVTIKEIPKKLHSRLKLFNSLPSYDVVLLQRKLFQRWTLWYLRKKSKVLMYDFDDALMFRDSNAPSFHSPSGVKRFKCTVKRVDLVISGNEYLRELASSHAKKVYVIPTGIDTQVYTQKNLTDNQFPLTIGWIGSKPNLIYLKELIEPLNKLYEMTKAFKLKIVCDDFIDGFECPVEKKLWKKDDEVKDIQSFDIGVFPLFQDRWTRGKCALKLLQYMACAVASVSSATDVTSHIVRDGVNGYLASTATEWLEKLNLLTQDPAKRRSIGMEARQSLDGSFDAKTIAFQYADLFEDSS